MDAEGGHGGHVSGLLGSETTGVVAPVVGNKLGKEFEDMDDETMEGETLTPGGALDASIRGEIRFIIRRMRRNGMKETVMDDMV